MARLPSWSTILILTIYLTGNLILPLVNHKCYLLLPTHDHIILGPVHPGWENHSHGEPVELVDPWQGDNHSHDDASHTPAYISDGADLLTQSKVISIAHPHTGHLPVISYGGQPLLLTDWLPLPELGRLTWLLDLTYILSLGIFLSPPDKPPKLFTNLH